MDIKLINRKVVADSLPVIENDIPERGQLFNFYLNKLNDTLAWVLEGLEKKDPNVTLLYKEENPQSWFKYEFESISKLFSIADIAFWQSIRKSIHNILYKDTYYTVRTSLDMLLEGKYIPSKEEADKNPELYFS